ncbi:MAG: thioester reductase domain-containing protein [Myxococcota bacterium]
MDPTTCRTLVELLVRRAESTPDALAFRWLPTGEADGPVETWTFAQVHTRAAAIAATLTERGLRGERALLLFPPGLDFVAAFFGCVYAGVIAVPAYPPDPTRLEASLPRLLAIVRDARPAALLTNSFVAMLADGLAALAPELAVLEAVVTDTVDLAQAPDWRAPPLTTADLAFLQYTSGSTGTPKGVMISHGNLLANHRSIAAGVPLPDDTDGGVSWLPLFHDMGLIGNVLQPVWFARPITLMSPLDFLRKPLRWLRAVSHFRATISGGPDFAYALCAKKVTPTELAALDLSRWRIAYSGAEPVRAETLRRFAEVFAPAGFRASAFYPTYGLAEATLMVSAPVPEAGALVSTFDGAALSDRHVQRSDDTDGTGTAREIVSCGPAAFSTEIAIVDPTTGQRLPPDGVGEIRVRGPSVAGGYWDRPDASAHTFDAVVDSERGWLRTGDLGFLHAGALHVAGRIKDVIIVHGKNHYPQDLERTVEGAHPAIRPGCVAAFALEEDGAEGVGIVAEIEGAADQLDLVEAAIRGVLSAEHALQAHGIALVGPRTAPKTSSGKIQRHAAKLAWEQGTLVPLKRAGRAPKNPAGLPVWLADWLRDEGKIAPEALRAEATLADLGLDSVAAVQLAGVLEEHMGTEVPLEALHGKTLGELAAWIGSGEGLLGVLQRADLDGAAKLDATIRPSGAAAGPCTFLTGATGFVGVYLLAALQRRGVTDITCLVRAATPDAGKARVLAAAAKLGVSVDPGFTVVTGDLKLPRLGLDAATFAAIATTCGRLVHCGAEVDWGLPFARLAAANVDGTKEIARMACLGGGEVHFVSSLGVYPVGLSARATFEESAPLTEGHMLRLGYFQSKYAAEKVMEEARARGVAVTIYRPAYVTGDARTGAELDPDAQLLFAFVKGALRLGQVPAVEKVIDAVPVDFVAEAIAALALDPASTNRAFNLKSPAPLQQGELYRRLRARGWRIESAAFPRWRERVLALPKTDPANSLARFAGYYSAVTPQLMRRLESVMAVAMPAEDAAARAALAPHGITCPSVASLLDPWIDRALRDGRLPEPARAEVLGTLHAPTLLPLDVLAQPWTAGLPDEEARLLRLYSRAKARQWDAEKRIDWSLDLDPENPEALPDQHIPIFGSPVWNRLTPSERVEVKRHYQGWQLSQFFAGEQGAMLCASRIVAQAPTSTARLYAATQVVDEARHLEIFGRLLTEKVGVSYEASTPLKRLLDDILHDRRWDVTCLGMQVLIEGLGLAAFSLVRDHTSHPLIATAHAYVCEDEARHVSFGKLLLSDLYPRLSDAERAEREEFVIEASYLLRDRFSGREAWERLGLPVEGCLRWIEDAGQMGAYRAELFRRIVPVVKSIGLWSPRVQDAYKRMGVYGFGELDVDALIADDERVAQRLGARRRPPADTSADV